MLPIENPIRINAEVIGSAVCSISGMIADSLDITSLGGWGKLL